LWDDHLSRDIFVHNDDCDQRLFDGARVTFDVIEKYDKKKECYTYWACNVSVSKFEPSIEMHFDTSQPIVHPVVEMRLCYSRRMHEERAKLLAQGYGYAFVLLKSHGCRSATVNGSDVFAAGDPFRFVEFTRPGKWFLRLMLIRTGPKESSLNRSRDLEARLRNKFKGGSTYVELPEDMVVWEDPDHKERNPRARYGEWPFEDSGETKLVAVSEVEVEIPEGIFAPEPPRWLKDYATYFLPGRSADQCRFRRRYPLMVLQTPFYAAWELLKRLGHGLWSLAQVLDMRQGGVQNLLATAKPAVRFHIMTPNKTLDDDDHHRGRVGPWAKRWGFLATPLALMLIAAFWRFAWTPVASYFPASSFSWGRVGIIVMVVVVPGRIGKYSPLHG
jgi:hypothetical protein